MVAFGEAALRKACTTLKGAFDVDFKAFPDIVHILTGDWTESRKITSCHDPAHFPHLSWPFHVFQLFRNIVLPLLTHQKCFCLQITSLGFHMHGHHSPLLFHIFPSLSNVVSFPPFLPVSFFHFSCFIFTCVSA